MTADKMILESTYARLRVVRHKKTGGEYIILCGDATKEDDLTPVVVYQSLETGRVWVRPVTEFMDGRFERVSV